MSNMRESLPTREACLKELERCLKEHRSRFLLAREEDIVKFVFQGMLGAGHLISSEAAAVRSLKAETENLQADPEEPLYEPLGSIWCRINLRPALARGIWAEEIAMLVCRSVEKEQKLFTREDVRDFCLGLADTDPERMRRALEGITEEDWLPSHSAAYREAYRPAYRVVLAAYAKGGDNS